MSCPKEPERFRTPHHPTVYVRKPMYDHLGGYHLDFGSAADSEWLIRLFVKQQARLAYLPRVTVRMLAGGLSNSGLRSRFVANSQDARAWAVNGLRPCPLFRLLKPGRKILQYL